MELRQLRYFVQVVDMGSIGKAALELFVTPSALSQQIVRLEESLGVTLLKRLPSGSIPTEAGFAFYKHAQLVLRYAENARLSAQLSKLAGRVSVGLTPATLLVLGEPLFSAMINYYPDVELHLVEAFSGYLSQMLTSRQLDMAILFEAKVSNMCNVTPLLDEDLLAICSPVSTHAFTGKKVSLEVLAKETLILPSGQHGMRRMLDNHFAKKNLSLTSVIEVDSLAMLVKLVQAGYGVTVQQSAVIGHPESKNLRVAQVEDANLSLRNLLVSLPEYELSTAAMAARAVLHEVVEGLVNGGYWAGKLLR